MELYELSKVDFENLARWHPEFRVWIARHALSYVNDAEQQKATVDRVRVRQDSVVKIELASGYPAEKDEAAKSGARGIDQLSGLFKKAVGDIQGMTKRRKNTRQRELKTARPQTWTQRTEKREAEENAIASAMTIVENRGAEDNATKEGGDEPRSNKVALEPLRR
jgi:hypothetical protein